MDTEDQWRAEGIVVSYEDTLVVVLDGALPIVDDISQPLLIFPLEGDSGMYRLLC